jgi:hypothetical protein
MKHPSKFARKSTPIGPAEVEIVVEVFSRIQSHPTRAKVPGKANAAAKAKLTSNS